MTERYSLLSFDSTHDAMEASRLLADLSPATMPTLREITASCGISLRLTPEREKEAVSRLGEARIPFRLHRVRGEDGFVTCEAVQ